MSTGGTTHKATQREIGIEILTRRGLCTAIQTILRLTPSRKIHQRLMLGWMKFTVFPADPEIPCIKRTPQNVVCRLPIYFTVSILADGTRCREKPLHFRNCLIVTRGQTLDGFFDYRGRRFFWRHDLAALFGLDIAIAWDLAEAIIALLHPGAHFLGDLTPILFPLKFALRSRYGFKELTLGAVFKIKIETFANSAALGHDAAKPEMKLRVAGIAFEIVEYNDKAFVRPRIEIGKERHHTGALHKITSTRNIIWKDGFDLVAFGGCILTATMLLGIQAVPLVFLFFCGDAAVNHRLFRGIVIAVFK